MTGDQSLPSYIIQKHLPRSGSICSELALHTLIINTKKYAIGFCTGKSDGGHCSPKSQFSQATPAHVKLTKIKPSQTVNT